MEQKHWRKTHSGRTQCFLLLTPTNGITSILLLLCMQIPYTKIPYTKILYTIFYYFLIFSFTFIFFYLYIYLNIKPYKPKIFNPKIFNPKIFMLGPNVMIATRILSDEQRLNSFKPKLGPN